MENRRILGAQGAPNLRDLGGYETADGRRVKWGLVFRSDDLSVLTVKDRALLENLGIRTVVDFRDRTEVAMHPDRLPPTAGKYVNLPIEAGKLFGEFDGKLTRRKTMGIMITVYRALVNDYESSFREFFALLADPDNLPLLFHCTAGKDRTGLAAALFLSALGVERKTVIEDYLLSRECLKNKYVFGVDYDEDFEPLYSVFPEFIESAFGVIDGGYGAVETFLTEKLGVDIPSFRKTFSE